jgi:hypothetical protein
MYGGSVALSGATVVALALVSAGSLAADASLASNRALWMSADVTAYRYTYEKYCECHKDAPAQTTVTVENNRVTRVGYRPAGYSSVLQVPERNYRWYWTVDGLFALLEAATRRGARVEVSYDTELGYPRHLHIDYDRSMVGEEVDVRVLRLEPDVQ